MQLYVKVLYIINNLGYPRNQRKLPQSDEGCLRITCCTDNLKSFLLRSGTRSIVYLSLLLFNIALEEVLAWTGGKKKKLKKNILSSV